MITLFGATGYTGQLVARALDRAGLPFRIAGRSKAKLTALSGALVSHPPTLAADARRLDSLAGLFDDTRLLINCAGPFTDLGEPVVAKAAARGVHYLDITNELAYVYRLRRYDELARKTGAAIVPACGFEVAIADCMAASLAAGRPEPIDEIAVVYAVSSVGMSVGTRLSALRALATSWLAYRGGQMVRQAPAAAARQFAIGARVMSAITFPSAEAVTLPSHVAVRDVTIWLAISRQAAGIGPGIMPALSGLLRTPLGWVAAQIIKRVAPLPDAKTRADNRFVIQVEARSGKEVRSQRMTGRDVYGLTAEIVAHAARVMTSEGYSKVGVLAPSQAFDAAGFLNWIRRYATDADSPAKAE